MPGGTARTHANGTTGITCLVVAVPKLDAAARAYERLLGVTAPAPVADPLLAAEAVPLPCGEATVHLTSAPAGPIHQRLHRLGPGPYALLLCTDTARLGWLDAGLCHGAPIRLQPAEK